jgi:hypothetical protein
MSTSLAPAGFAEVPGIGDRRAVPFDYLFTFRLNGTPDRVVTETVTVSVEGPFVTRAIGYGAVPDTPQLRFGFPSQVPVAGRPALPDFPLRAFVESLKAKSLVRRGLASAAEREIRLSRRATIGVPLVETVLRNGFRLNPETADLVLAGLLEGKDPALSDEALQTLFEAVAVPPEQIQFKYALYDQGSGRAFQSDPILNTAGLGISDGSRPFRELVPPITFAPRTTIRMDVIEVSQFPGTLFVALHGYKVLGASGTPTDVRRQLRRAARR